MTAALRSPPPPTRRYHPVAVALHWLLALLIVAGFVLGLYMTGLPISPARLKLYNLHKWLGIVILLLSALRLLWRLAVKPPADLPMPVWQRRAAHATHALLYLLFFAVPLAGWAHSSAVGFPVVLFGRWPLPDFVPVDRALGGTLAEVHEALAFTLAAAVVLHVGAALKHQFVDRDGLIDRMRIGHAAARGAR
jgi:cytochrome b561